MEILSPAISPAHSPERKLSRSRSRSLSRSRSPSSSGCSNSRCSRSHSRSRSRSPSEERRFKALTPKQKKAYNRVVQEENALLERKLGLTMRLLNTEVCLTGIRECVCTPNAHSFFSVSNWRNSSWIIRATEWKKRPRY